MGKIFFMTFILFFLLFFLLSKARLFLFSSRLDLNFVSHHLTHPKQKNFSEGLDDDKKKQEIGLTIVCTKSFSSFDIECSIINLYLLTWSTHSAT